MYSTELDTNLLHSWRTRRDPDAFAELVTRYGPLVYSACLRVVRDAPTAEDVAQECFVELLQTDRRVHSLPGWLHTMATRRGLDRLKMERRRMEREGRYAGQHPASVHPQWDDISQYVDEAIETLPEKIRGPIVLRFLQARSYAQLASELGVPASTIQYRLNQGIDRIRRHLIRRGIPVAGVSLVAMLSAAPAHALPVAVSGNVGKIALSGVATGTVSTAAGLQSALTLGGLLAVKKLAAVVIVLVALSFTAVYIVTRDATRPPVQNTVSQETTRTENTAPIVQDVSPDAASPAPSNEAGDADVEVSGVVVDNDGNAMPDALVKATWPTGSGSVHTDDDGHFRFTFPSDFTSDGPLTFNRRVSHGERTSTYTFQGAVTGDNLSGVIETGSGNVRVTGERVGHGNGAIGVWTTLITRGGEQFPGTLTLAANGLARLTGIWVDSYGSPNISDAGVPEIVTFTATLNQLKAFPEDFEIPAQGRNDITLAMDLTASVSGKIVDTKDVPQPDWDVFMRMQSEERLAGEKSDETGQFAFAGLAPGEYQLFATNSTTDAAVQYAEGPITLRPGDEIVGITLVWGLGLNIVGHVTGEDGQPIAGARVESWFDRAAIGEGSVYLPPESQTDASGRYELAGFPELAGLEVNLGINHEEYLRASRYGVRLDGHEQDFVLVEKPTIEGRVVDAVSGDPITRYRIRSWIGQGTAPGHRDEDYLRGTSRSSLEDHPGGVFSFRPDGYNSVHIGVSAPGYLSGLQTVPAVEPGATVQDVEIRLKRTEPIRGTVVDISGKPISEARIFLGYPLMVDGYIAVGGAGGVANSDDEGKFTITEFPPSLSVVSAYREGYAPTWTEISSPSSPLTITLTGGASVEGIVTYGGVPLDDARFYVNANIGETVTMQTETGKGGAYSLKNVPTGSVAVVASFHEGGLSRWINRTVTIHDGQTLHEDFDFGDAYDSYVEGVLLLNGTPVPVSLLRAIVTRTNGDTIAYQTQTRDDGSFTLGPIPATTLQFGAYLTDARTSFSGFGAKTSFSGEASCLARERRCALSKKGRSTWTSKKNGVEDERYNGI